MIAMRKEKEERFSQLVSKSTEHSLGETRNTANLTRITQFPVHISALEG